jgi:hypothetical protein
MRMSRVTRILASLLLLYSYSHSHASASEEAVDVATFLSGKERDGSATNGLKEKKKTTLRINELQHSDRGGGPDWVEILNGGPEDVTLEGLTLQVMDPRESSYSDVLHFDKSCGVTSLRPEQYLLLLEETQPDDADSNEALQLFFSILDKKNDKSSSSSSSIGVCRDIQPKDSRFGCDKQKQWGKCTDEWMIAGNYCAKTCKRCIDPPVDETSLVLRQKERNYEIARSCRLAKKIPHTGKMRLVYKQKQREEVVVAVVMDSVSWETRNNQTLGYTVGRPESKQQRPQNEKGLRVLGKADDDDVAAIPLVHLIEGSPGTKNAKMLSFGPLGPHWSGSNPLLNDRDVYEGSFKSNLPLAIIKTEDGKKIPQDPKVLAQLWMSSCTEFASEDLEEEHTLSGIVRNKDNVLCTLKDKAAYNGYAGIELRGRSSQRYPKKQFSFEFRDSIATENGIDLSPLNLPAEEDWVLGAPYVDRSLMRDALAFDMYMDQGYWAPKMQFIELFVMEGDRSRSHVNYNKHYKGIYVLKEKIKRGSNRVNISKMNETDISGGYLLVLSSSSHDGMLSTGEPPKEKVLDQGPARVSYVYPKKPTQSQQSYISQYLEDFQQALWSSNFNDPINGYAKYIDVPSWIDYFLHTEMTKNLDGYISSVYLHKDKGGKLVAGPAWDYNLAFGQATYWNSYYVEPWDFTYIGPNQKSYSQMVHWYYKLLQDPNFTQRLKRRYQELRQTVWTDSQVVLRIRKYRKLLGNSQYRNFQAWPINQVSTNHKYIPIKHWGSSWDANVNGLQSWVLDRLGWMDVWVPKM